MFSKQVRKKFFEQWEEVPLHNLIDIQTKSYEDFLQKDVFPEKRKKEGLQELLEDIFPIYSYDERVKLEFISYRFAPAKCEIEECLERGITYESALHVLLRLSDETGTREEDVFLGYFPMMTENGSFLINGSERVLVSQIHRAPGIYFERGDSKIGKREESTLLFKIMPYRGSWLVVEVDSNSFIHVYMERNKKRRRVLGTTFLRAIGLSKNVDIFEKFYELVKIPLDEENVDAIVGSIAARPVVDNCENIVIGDGDSLTTATAMSAIKAGIREIEIVKNATSSDPIVKMIRSDPIDNHKDALKHCFRKMYPDEPATLANARFGMTKFFFDKRRYNLGEVGRYKINKSLGFPTDPESLKNSLLSQNDILAAMKKLLAIKNREPGYKLDDIDDLSNRRVRLSGELVGNQCRMGLLRIEKIVKEKLSMADVSAESLTPGRLVSSKILTVSMKELFARSQLSQYMDQTNPLSEISHKRRFSALGAGGIQRERAGLEVRDVHTSHYGRICPVETPEGPSIGLITSLALCAKVNRLGFIETPYFVAKDGKLAKEVVYLTADEEAGKNISQAVIKISKDGEIEQEDCLIRKDGEISEVNKKQVDLVEVSSSQLLSAGTSLIPFLEHDDTNRALMGANMQRQAVPVICPESPIVGTGLERKIAKDAGAVIIAPVNGIIKYFDGKRIEILDENNEICNIKLKKFNRSNSGMCLNYKPIVKIGEKVSKGDVIADGSASKQGELALGKDIFVGFMPYFGNNFEDAIVVSEEVIKRDIFTAIRIEKLEIVSRDTKLGQEEITRDIPNVAEENVRNLDDDGIIKVGSRVRSGDIIVGKVTPKVEGDLSPEERFLRAIFKDKAQNVKDTSLIAPLGIDGVVVDVKMFSRKDKINRADDVVISETEQVKKEKKEFLGKKADIENAGEDKVKALLLDITAPAIIVHRTKGDVIIEQGSNIEEKDINCLIEIGSENILDSNIKEYVEARKIIKNIEEEIESLSFKHKQIVDSIRKGDPNLDSGVLKHIVVHIAHKSPLEVGDKMAGRHGNKGVLSSIVPEEDMPFNEDGRSLEMILSPLGVPSRMNLGQLNETRLGFIGKQKGEKYACQVFRGASDEQIDAMCDEIGVAKDGKCFLYNGKTGDRFINRVVIGHMYVMRLNHFIADKMHSRSTGPYSFITQQPLGGKSRFGGQRFGEMEFWAAEAYGAAHFLLEMLTVKSDDVAGRTAIYQNIVKGEPILQTTQTESLRVLTKEIKGLCLDVRLENSKYLKEEDESSLAAKASEDISEDKFNKFDKLTLRLASEHVIRNVWSHGEVKKAETINYRTMRPEIGGLFCEKIFGPTKDWECACGKHKKIKNKGIVCDRCGVEVNLSRVRRERMAHIDLAIPVVHIWLLKNIPSRLGHLLGMTVSQLESIIYYEQYVIVEPKESNFHKKQLLSHNEYQELVDSHGADAVDARIGGDAISELLKKEDLHAVEAELKKAVKQTKSTQARMKLARRLRTIDGFLKSNNSIESLVLKCIPVIPPDVRPLIKLEGGRFATSDLNDLYRRLLYRNLRLKQIVKISKTPEVIVRNEMRLLQEAVDGVFDNGRRNTAISGAGNKILKPLSKQLRGKTGRFRQNMLGKRVDYSGRSVIVVGPELRINECGLPKEMAIQMFEPFIVRQLRIMGKARTVRSARRIIQRKTKEVWEIIESITKNHTVVLNRAPTLHRLSIQAFVPVLVEGKAIRLHPLVCSAFNADFDGDQMAVHLPLSVEAQAETKLLMMAADNIFLPASGKPIAMPTRDMTLGVFGLMIEPLISPDLRGKQLKTFASKSEVLTALAAYNNEYQKVTEEATNKDDRQDYLGYGIFLHEKIIVKIYGEKIATTPGRVVFDTVVPDELGFQNYPISQGRLSDLIMSCYDKLGLERTVVFLDDLKDLGFHVSTEFAISMGLKDICKPENKKAVLEKTSKQVKKINDQLASGIITEGEAESRIISAWTTANDAISEELFEKLEELENNKMNPLNIILSSGARGNKSQIRQLGGMRGLVAKPSGAIITFPVRGSFREGLSPIEFFISTHGGRKGLADTALKTADAGYLTRRLVDVSQEILVREEDCESVSGITISGIHSGNEEVLALKTRVIGRFVASDVVGMSGDVIIPANTLIDSEEAELLDTHNIKSVEIRSPLSCLTERGVCAKCYGVNLADRKVAVIGETVGILAAQSIGEPGTQLTMRTFHMGGVASTDIVPEWIVDRKGVVIFNNLKYIEMSDENLGDYALITGRSGSLCIVDPVKDVEDQNQYIEMIKNKSIVPAQEFKAEVGAKIFVKPMQLLKKKGEKIAEIDTDSMPIISEHAGTASYQDIIEGVTIERVSTDSSRSSDVIVNNYNESLCPVVNIVDLEGHVIATHYIPTGAIISVKEGDKVEIGQHIARIPRSSLRTQDIIGGLQRVTEIVEARKPANPAEIAQIDGYVSFKGIQKGKRIVSIVDAEDPTIEMDHPIHLSKQLIVHNGDRVYAGQQLTNGIPSIDEILRICGIQYLQKLIVDQIQEVYRMQGVDINDKHIEIIVRRMMNKLSIVDHGDATRLIFGDEVTRQEFEEINNEIIRDGGRPAKAKVMLSGITQSALTTTSLISAASFQNPAQGLLEGALRGSEDNLIGCKENIIVANKMPAGTGFEMHKHGISREIEESWINEKFDDDIDWTNRINLSEKYIENLKDIKVEEVVETV